MEVTKPSQHSKAYKRAHLLSDERPYLSSISTALRRSHSSTNSTALFFYVENPEHNKADRADRSADRTPGRLAVANTDPHAHWLGVL